MDRAKSTSPGTPQGHSSTQRRADPHAHAAPPPESGPALIAGRALVQTVRPFFPAFNHWLDRLPDTRAQEACTYSRRLLAWWGIALGRPFWKLFGSLRQVACRLLESLRFLVWDDAWFEAARAGQRRLGFEDTS